MYICIGWQSTITHSRATGKQDETKFNKQTERSKKPTVCLVLGSDRFDFDFFAWDLTSYRSEVLETSMISWGQHRRRLAIKWWADLILNDCLMLSLICVVAPHVYEIMVHTRGDVNTCLAYLKQLEHIRLLVNVDFKSENTFRSLMCS